MSSETILILIYILIGLIGVFAFPLHEWLAWD
jgi:hypothetical protein